MNVTMEMVLRAFKEYNERHGTHNAAIMFYDDGSGAIYSDGMVIYNGLNNSAEF